MNFVGGPPIEYIDKAEPGLDFNISNFLLKRMRHETTRSHLYRLLYNLWMALGIYGVCIPWCAELAWIPLVGGSLAYFGNQSMTISIFAVIVALLVDFFVLGMIWF